MQLYTETQVAKDRILSTSDLYKTVAASHEARMSGHINSQSGGSVAAE